MWRKRNFLYIRYARSVSHLVLTFCNRSQPLVHKIEVHDPGLKCKKLKAFDLCGQMSDSFNLKLKLIIQAKED